MHYAPGAFIAFWISLCIMIGGQASADGSRDRVTVGALITSISAVDLSDGSFNISAYVWFSDPSGLFDPDQHLLVYSRDVNVRTVQRIQREDGGWLTAVEVRASVDQNYDSRDFPFDSQTLRLGFETSYDTDQLEMKGDADDLAVADFVKVKGWDIQKLGFEHRYETYKVGFGGSSNRSFSSLSVLIDLKRQRSGFVIEKFVGFTMALLIASLIYYVPTDQIGVRVSMVTSAILAAVGNRYALDNAIGVEATFGLVDRNCSPPWHFGLIWGG